MRKASTLVTFAVLVTTAGSAATAMSAATRAAQQFTFKGGMIGARTLPITVTARGVISGRGTASLTEHPASTSGTFVFAGGAIRIHFVHGPTTAKPDPRACRATIDARGTYTIVGGSERFAGIKGSGTYDEKRVLVGRRQASGACVSDRRATPKSVTAVATMIGTVSLG